MTNPRAELLSFLEASDVVLPQPFDDDTPLLSSGVLDSLALFNLLLWVEEKTGRPIDPTQMDLVSEWDSVGRILAYLGDDASAPHPSSPTETPEAPGRIRVIPYEPRHREAVARLQKGLWSPDEALNLRYLDWKHEENPCGDGSRIYLAVDGDEVVGMRSFYPSRWEVGQPTRTVDLLVADDLLVRPGRRDEGIVTLLMRAAFEDLRARGVEYVLNLTGGKVTVLGSLAMGWRSAGRLEPVTRRSRGARIRRRLRAGLGSMRLVWRFARSPWLYTPLERNPFLRFDEQLGWHRRDGMDVELSATPRISDMAELAGDRGQDGRLRHVRDESFLSWRLRNPLHEYRYAYAGADVLLGFAILRRRASDEIPWPGTWIVDFQARDPRTLRILLETVLDLGRFSELTTWQATLSPSMVQILDGMGLTPIKASATRGWRTILVRSLDEDRPEEEWRLNGTSLLDPASWDLRMLDTMAG